ncbi:MAG: hypothetical protein RLZZ65_1073 [Bacteroidota bacterium]|jgi:uncharacterized glyoxalase superfamily protein PhnB
MIKHIQLIQTILFVEDQEVSCAFYQKLFRVKAELHVPGMTEFIISEHSKIGLMPNKGIAKILADNTPHPSLGKGIPRCELYFYVEDLEVEFKNALACGAKLISPILDRDWGDQACYFADPDGHVIAFAKKINA